MVKNKDSGKLRPRHVKKRRMFYKLLLLLPPLLALIMITVLSFTSSSITITEEGIMLSPVKDASPLIFSLSIFVIGYAAFFAVLFKYNVKDFLSKNICQKPQVK